MTFLKKNTGNSTAAITKGDGNPSITRQCELLGVSRSSAYYRAKVPTTERLEREETIKACLYYWHTKQCCLGARRLGDKLRKEDDLLVGRKLIRRFMDEMGLCAVYPKPNLSKHGKDFKPFPYLLKNKTIFLPNKCGRWTSPISKWATSTCT